MTTDSASARSALDAAERSSTLIVRRTRGLRWTMLAFSAATAAGLLLVGVGPRPFGIIFGTVLIAGAGGALGATGAASSALPAGFRRRYAITIAVWTAVYAAVLLVGLLAFPGSVAFWALGAVASVVPGLWFSLAERAQS
ncbi:hypothetical protein Sked_12110 [Sanguibacter keddieii DSM 10542]|uniref:Uncharacterized protein n=1 Tax=Sanguibacter keddieii (strain ATCC 51767 / DSM 10542 / NCFB 3025 / ST-74) TaxID=446469 RepID=D1BE75_SANKS|nr:hypothetical protein [Sanguibacter keddieii]ACZ21153.1 hypothetical protein Sked_12110 [Sanguibacter keddieii DSM 10542]